MSLTRAIRGRRVRPDDLGSFRRQLVLLTGVLGTVVAITLVAVVAIVLEHVSSSVVDRVLTDRAYGVIAAAGQSGSTTTPQVPASLLEPGVAVYDGDGRLVAGEAPASLSRVFETLSEAPRPSGREMGDHFQVLARPFRTPAGASGTVVLAEPLEPYENDVRYGVLVSVAAGALIVLLATWLASFTSRRALAPVAAMAATAEQWSEHDLDRRFDLGAPTNEIRSLGHTLDGLLDKVTAAIVAEQRLTGELAHELRSPLTAVQGTAQLIAMRDDLDDQLREDIEDVLVSCRAMAATVTGLLDLARASAGSPGESTCRLRDVVEDVRLEVDPHHRVEDVTPSDVVLAVPQAMAVRALAPVVHNAVGLAGRVEVDADLDGPLVRILVRDDGPGVAATVAGDLFEPGRSHGGGSGLGLALARRVARSVGGDVTLAPPPNRAAPGTGSPDAGGATFVVSLPGGRRRDAVRRVAQANGASAARDEARRSC